MAGGPLAAVFVEMFGRKVVLMCSHIPLCIGWILIIQCGNAGVLYAGRIFLGLFIGMISLTAPLYIAEVSRKVSNE